MFSNLLSHMTVVVISRLNPAAARIMRDVVGDFDFVDVVVLAEELEEVPTRIYRCRVTVLRLRTCVGFHDLVERNGGYHGRVSQRLEFHMAAVITTLQLDNHESSIAIERQ